MQYTVRINGMFWGRYNSRQEAEEMASDLRRADRAATEWKVTVEETKSQW